MIFEDLYKIDNPEEKEAKTIDFYLTEIKVDKWIKPFSESVIRFQDRKEYRKDNKLHRLNGPAIEYHSSKKGIYYIDGKKIEYNEWLVISKRRQLNKKLKKIKDS